MSEPIKVGDLVMVVREGIPCPRGCGLGPHSLGKVFQVAIIEETGLHCAGCGADKGRSVTASDAADKIAFRLFRLKRIPPLEELDDVKREQEIEA